MKYVMLEYKGYKTKIQYDEQDDIYWGLIIDTNITFENPKLEYMINMFHCIVDDYIKHNY